MNGDVPLGLPCALARRTSEATIISSVEQINDGSTLLTFADAAVMPNERLGRIRERGAVRLTPDEREELIARLMDHRFAALVAPTPADNEH